MERNYTQEMHDDPLYMNFANQLCDLVEKFMKDTNAEAISFNFFADEKTDIQTITDLTIW